MDRDGLTVMPEAAPTLVAAPTRGGSFRALRSPSFRIYFAGQVASASGTFLQQTAIGWLVLQLTHSASTLGVVLAVGGIPSLLFGPWGGSIADRVDLRRLLIATQILNAVLAGILWAFAAAGHASVAVLVGVGVAAGIVSIVDSPARQAFVSSLVPPEDLASAVSLNGVVFNGARVIGPALAGALIVTVGTTPCFAINAVSYLAVIAALFFVHPISSARRSTSASGVLAALTYARSRQQLWLPLVMMALVGLLAFNFAVILPVLAEQTLHGGGGTYSLLSTMLSIGSVIGSLAVGLLRHPRRIYLATAALVFGVGLTLTGLAPGVPAACVTLLLTGIAAFCFVTLASTTLQLHSSSAFRGRVMALWVFVYLGTTPIGSVLTGWTISAGGPRLALWIGAGACVLAAAVAFRVHTPPNPDAALTDLPTR